MTLPPEPPSLPSQGQQPAAGPARGSVSESADAPAGQIVRCRRCEQDLPAGAMFCPHCGTPIEVLCNSCRTVNSPGNRFCMHCGQSLDAQAAATTASTAAQSQPITHPPQADGAPAASQQTSPQPAAPLPASTPPAPDAPAPAPAIVYEAPPSGALTCPRCRKVNELAARYCYSCGLPLDETRKAELSSSSAAQEAVFHGRPAGFWVRLIAFIIDGAVLTALFFALWPSVFGVPYVDLDAASMDFGLAYGFGPDRTAGENLFGIVIQAAYFTLTTSLWGATLGKRVFNLRVAGHDGRRLSLARALGRYFATFVSVLIIFIGYIMIAVRKDKRALHDLIADTWVVHK